MLHLQRASAGSGKTYTLARTFITDYLVATADDGSHRLRFKEELADALPRILAVTFTNKATNEMKQRIVERLAELSRPTPGTPYLAELRELTGSSTALIAKMAGEALAVLLNNYSDFKVSTIDSFFQTILRTFAYETDLNDTYQIELDSDYVAEASLKALLDDIDARRNPRGEYWASHIMRKAQRNDNKGWNVFQDSTASTSVYRRIIGSIKRLESEDFKQIREDLDIWAGEHPDFGRAYGQAARRVEARLKKLHTAMLGAMRALPPLFAAQGLDIEKDSRRYMWSQVKKALSSRPTDLDTKTKWLTWDSGEEAVKAALVRKLPDTTLGELREAAAEAYALHEAWREELMSPAYRLWSIYDRLLPFLGLIMEVRKKTGEYLETTNSVQIGETNSILRRIIGDDDAPFIYERLGSRINHYLIDEFQDTSRLQWEVLHPLVAESMGRGQDNLIIGDAKQSIYRFRNAEPELITTTVPRQFPGHHAAGLTPEENTNWRSRRRIVEFNNYFFKALSEEMHGADSGYINLRELYGNVVQRPHHTDDRGYVEIDFVDAYSGDNDEGESVPFPYIGPKVREMLERGYRMRDVAVLVRTNDDGQMVIASINSYNLHLPEGESPIEVVSEESLRIGGSPAVEMIVNALRTINTGMETGGTAGLAYYTMRHPEMDPSEHVARYETDTEAGDALASIASDMQTVALPALVEALAERCLSPAAASSEAIYLAAFQDLVTEYCEGHSTDIGSFLEWWDTRGKDKAVSSPETTDAVQVMTIHKSKGLEFPCVIIPKADSELLPGKNKEEWAWVRPSPESLESGVLPPWVPVVLDGNLEDTPHEATLRRYVDAYLMDSVNTYYVAFTRAVDELHVYAKRPTSRDEGRISQELMKLCDPEENGGKCAGEEYVADPCGFEMTRTGDGEVASITYGRPSRHEAPAARETRHFIIDRYDSNSHLNQLHYVEADGGDESTAETERGEKLHAIMQMTERRGDLHGAVEKVRMRGRITSAEALEMEALLSEALEMPEVAPWYGGDWKVMSERDIYSQSGTHRPDRVMVSPDGRRAVVVDYKFGSSAGWHDHRRQVKKYMELIASAGSYELVEGWVWYVSESELRRVK